MDYNIAYGLTHAGTKPLSSRVWEGRSRPGGTAVIVVHLATGKQHVEHAVVDFPWEDGGSLVGRRDGWGRQKLSGSLARNFAKVWPKEIAQDRIRMGGAGKSCVKGNSGRGGGGMTEGWEG